MGVWTHLPLRITGLECMVAVWQLEQVGGTKADVVAFLLFIASSYVVTRDLNTMRYFSKHNALDTSIGLIPNIM